MTCIIGFVDKKKDCVWMGCDSLGSNGWTKAVEANSKAFHHFLLKDVVIGSTSTFRHIDLLKYSDNLFQEIDAFKKPEINHKDIVTVFIPKLITLFQNNTPGFADTNKGGNFLMGVKNQLFEIQQDYSVLQPLDGIAAVGCGEQVAMGSLITTTKYYPNLKPSQHITYALEAAEKYCCGVQRPFRIINTKNEEVIMIE